MAEGLIILGVDKDDVTDSTQPHMVSHFNEEHPKDPVDGIELYREGHEHSRFEEFSTFFNQDDQHRRLFLHCINVRPRRDARLVLPRLAKDPAVGGVYHVTGRYHFALGVTLKHTYRNFGAETFDYIETTQYLSSDDYDPSSHHSDQVLQGMRNPGKLTKLDIYDLRGVTHVVEDLPPQVRDAAESGRKVFMMDQPWNQDVQIPGVERVHSWYEASFKILGRMAIQLESIDPEKPPVSLSKDEMQQYYSSLKSGLPQLDPDVSVELAHELETDS